ncbi:MULTISPECIES: hypothetical protein [Staphylococcus]|uniref:Uncharacterized protein n=1 Tax=Staphylococcus schleiferi TaxID=1295 RepID=A0A7Z7QSA5_STASC|nr:MULTISPECIES: hypothetical protein [Staphylococcus]QGS46620.1 hypothetical protein FOB90_07975 [Mammaliicoccus fleurettii]EPD49941.1 hypothetical protein HMPREF1208_01477 [Staphylococcus sp. HGB0015]MBF1992569.1 hypothetical protein [Staphylococcus schleiferi]MBF2038181.1 hypothetical protein [Staphylococcus schleiferi]MBF2100067.1 hypothetical protein [Staphylococcus schleiferi]
MRKTMYSFHILSNTLLVLFLFIPIPFLNYEGGDILSIYFQVSLILFVLSVTLYFLNQKNRKTWMISTILSILSILIVFPVVFFYLFFGIPPA